MLSLLAFFGNVISDEPLPSGKKSFPSLLSQARARLVPMALSAILILDWSRVKVAFIPSRAISLAFLKIIGAVAALLLFPLIPAAAQPLDATQLLVQITSGNQAGDDSSSALKVGDTFQVDIIAAGVPEPGIFAAQFELSYQPDYLEPIENSLVSGVELEPALVTQALFDPAQGRISYAAQRQAEFEGLTRNFTLATLTFQATRATDLYPTLISLQAIKLDAKDGTGIPLGSLTPLELVIEAEAGPQGSLGEQVWVEGREATRQAGHQVMAIDFSGRVFTGQTDPEGQFRLEEVPPGTYTLVASSPGFLSATCQNVVHQEGETLLQPVTLLAGDLDNSGAIDVVDVVTMGTAFGRTDPAEVANLNADPSVDVLDLILLAANFERAAADYPWLCQ